jgi:hypothetical protein
VDGGSRQDTKIRAEPRRPGDVAAGGYPGDEARRIWATTENRECEPPVECGKREVDNDRVEGVVDRVEAVISSDELYTVNAVVTDDEHTRDHCRPPP